MRKRTNISHQQFFQVCEALRNHREELNGLDKEQVRDLISVKVGFAVSMTAIHSALKATGITLSRRARAKNPAGNSARVIGTALVRLYKKLGEEVPERLTLLVNRLNVGVAEGVAESNGVPASSVPDPRTLAVVRK